MLDGCLVFIHIPKTAGATLNRVLGRQYRESETITFTTLDRPIDDIGKIPPEQLARARIVRGHVHYGIHEYLPRPSSYITMLREPTARVLSLYHYILRQPDHPLHKAMRVSSTPLAEYISSGMDRNQVDNGQTRQMAGIQSGDVTANDLETAKRHLETCLVVGLTESFDQSLVLMRRRLGWRMPLAEENAKGRAVFVSRNVSPERNKESHYSGDLLELIRERNRLDLELYELAKQLFQNLVNQQDESFEGEVARLSPLTRPTGRVESPLNNLLDRVRYSTPVRRLRSRLP